MRDLLNHLFIVPNTDLIFINSLNLIEFKEYIVYRTIISKNLATS